MRSWLRRVDEEGESALIQTTEPVNKFRDFLRYLVKQLKVLVPTMGKARIAQVPARASLHLGVTTAGRMLKEPEPMPTDAGTLEVVETRVITARHPGEVWHMDLTTVPTEGGFWVPWVPFALPQAWPFCWWVAVVVDHFSRAVVGFALFHDRPTSGDIQRVLERAVRRAGHGPRYVITDKGRQFWCHAFKQWCRRKAIRVRLGAVGKQGSIAAVERFIRSMKTECTRPIRVPLRMNAMRYEVGLYTFWYNNYRPNQALGGRTPWGVYEDIRPANAKPRFEPRRSWAAKSPCAGPQTGIRGARGEKLSLVSPVCGRQTAPARRRASQSGVISKACR
jgi:transposase InsO family protein